MDPLKQAFIKVKQDILNLQAQINIIHQEIQEIKRTKQVQTETQKNQTDSNRQTDNPTHNLPLEALKSPFSDFSTGNNGVPTDRQTIRQTDNPSQKFGLEKATEILQTFDQIKGQIISQIHNLTPQEISVFTTIYQLEEEGFIVDYSLLSTKLNLTQSSIRDYTRNLIKKGIPIIKIKEKNKKITLKISESLKKIASLSTILQLRNQRFA